MQISTAISDGVLALCAFYGAFILYRGGGATRAAAALGFALVGLAAAVGTVRFGFAPSVKPVHGFLSGFAAMVGMPLIGLAYLNSVWNKLSSRVFMIIAAGLFIAAVAANLSNFVLLRTILGGLGTIAVIVSAVMYFKSSATPALMALGGAVLVLVAGLVIKTKGQWAGILRVDWFHYTLAIGYFLLAFALLKYVARRSD